MLFFFFVIVFFLLQTFLKFAWGKKKTIQIFREYHLAYIR